MTTGSSLTWTTLGALDLIKSEFLSAKWQSKQIISYIPSWSWRTWVIGVLTLIVIALLEGAYRRDEQTNQEKLLLSHEVEELKGKKFENRMLPESTANIRNEWLSISGEICTCCKYLRADWTHNTLLGEEWRIAGGTDGMCTAWLRHAGEMLLRSDRVRKTLSKRVLEEPNPVYRCFSI